jgi:hypothetical protein
MLASDAIEPAFAPAGDVEIGAVDGEHPALHHHAFPEPVRQFQRHAARPLGLFVDQLGPAVEPRECRLAPVFRANVGLDRGRHQPVQCLPQQFIGTARGRPADGAQQIIGHDMQLARHVIGPAPRHIGHLAGAIDQNVGIPDRGHAVIGIGADMHPHLAVGAGVIDRLHPLRLGEAEEGALHHLALVAQGQVRQIGQEQVELFGYSLAARLAHGQARKRAGEGGCFPGETRRSHVSPGKRGGGGKGVRAAITAATRALLPQARTAHRARG